MAASVLFGHGAGMSDYLTNLLTRTRYPERTIQPRVPSMFDPVSPASMGGGVGGLGPEVESHPAIRVNQSVQNDHLWAGYSSQDTVWGPEVSRPNSEQDPQHRALSLESTAAREQRDAASETTSLSEPEGVPIETKPVLGQLGTKPRVERGIQSRHPVVPLPENGMGQPGQPSAQEITVRYDEVTTSAAPSRVDDERRGATSRKPSEDKAVSLSPIDRSIAGQEGTAAFHKPTAQPAGSPSRVPSDWPKGSASSRTSSFIEESAREQSSIPLTGGESRPRDRELSNNGGTYGSGVGPHSSQHSLRGVPTSPSDREPKRPIPARREVLASEMPDLSELSLDPSLVSPASVLKPSPTSRPIAPRNPGNPQGPPSAPADMKEVILPSLAGPMASKTFIAAPRAAVPRAVATVNHRMAADGAKPAESVVQVTIGRVEVRAVAPPVRQEKGRKAQSAMSLDDYLKRRGGRSAG